MLVTLSSQNIFVVFEERTDIRNNPEDKRKLESP
jgi:hypothetical protein